MPDWIHTLEARFAGRHAGFLDTNTPLEEQDEHEGGPNVPQPSDEPLPAPAIPDVTPGDAGSSEESPAETSSSTRSRSK
jgi:hypothetical protein